MNKFVIKDKAVVFNMNDVSTDHIYPAKYCRLINPAEIAEHVMEGADITLKDRFKTVGKILVAANNFASGSSREHAVITLQSAGVQAVICNTAGRIWFRNAINLAFPVIICPGFVDTVQEGDELEIDLTTGVIKNLTKGTEHQGEPMSEYMMNVFEHGGIKSMMLSKYGLEQ